MNGSIMPSVLMMDDLCVHVAVAVRAITCTLGGYVVECSLTLLSEQNPP